MSMNDPESPESPKEAPTQSASKDEDDGTSVSAEHDIDSETVSKETVKENSDDIGNELDYEEEITPPVCPEHNTSDKIDESKAKDPSTGGDEDKKNDTQPVLDANKDKGDFEEGEDEGEISGEEDDLEEGELKDVAPFCETSLSQSSRQICRFFTRGQCYYGTACRFLHLTNNGGKGQYNMFARYSDGYYGAAINPMMPDRSNPHTGIDYMSAIPAPPIHMEQSPVESAWERGLREAKELVKRANKRKEEEPDFDKKKNYLSINFNDFNTEKNTDYDKENDHLKSSYGGTKRNPDTHYRKKNSRESESLYGDGTRVSGARDHLRSGGPRYENFEIHYTHTRDELPQRSNFDRRTRDRSRGRLNSSERERYASKERNRDRNKVKEDRAMFHVEMRARAFDYIDPWRRSKTPKPRGARSRSGSYSSVSSSYSDRSSRSASGSYSRSSSRSSCASSRSPSVKQKTPDPAAEFSKAGSSKFSMLRKKPSTARSPYFSSRSRSPPSSARSVSRSRSYSRSISMDSVSSDSSISHSSCESPRNRNPSLAQKKPIIEKLPLEKLDEHRAAVASGELNPYDLYPSEAPVDNPIAAFPSFQHLIPQEKKSVIPTKQPIKLTLLPKPTTSKPAIQKKEIDRTKLMLDIRNDTSKPDAPNYTSTGKRPLSPTLSLLHQKPDSLSFKKSTSSRRDELLKQLKAVEDAIARKRAKFF